MYMQVILFEKNGTQRYWSSNGKITIKKNQRVR